MTAIAVVTTVGVKKEARQIGRVVLPEFHDLSFVMRVWRGWQDYVAFSSIQAA